MPDMGRYTTCISTAEKVNVPMKIGGISTAMIDV
jgi:hypothetical protein